MNDQKDDDSFNRLDELVAMSAWSLFRRTKFENYFVCLLHIDCSYDDDAPRVICKLAAWEE